MQLVQGILKPVVSFEDETLTEASNESIVECSLVIERASGSNTPSSYVFLFEYILDKAIFSYVTENVNLPAFSLNMRDYYQDLVGTYHVNTEGSRFKSSLSQPDSSEEGGPISILMIELEVTSENVVYVKAPEKQTPKLVP